MQAETRLSLKSSPEKLSVAAVGLCKVKKVTYNALEPVCLVGKYVHIILCHVVHFLLFEKVDVADYRGQRSLEVVGNVGDKLDFHSLTLHLLLKSLT